MTHRVVIAAESAAITAARHGHYQAVVGVQPLDSRFVLRAGVGRIRNCQHRGLEAVVINPLQIVCGDTLPVAVNEP